MIAFTLALTPQSPIFSPYSATAHRVIDTPSCVCSTTQSSVWRSVDVQPSYHMLFKFLVVPRLVLLFLVLSHIRRTCFVEMSSRMITSVMSAAPFTQAGLAKHFGSRRTKRRHAFRTRVRTLAALRTSTNARASATHDRSTITQAHIHTHRLNALRISSVPLLRVLPQW